MTLIAILLGCLVTLLIVTAAVLRNPPPDVMDARDHTDTFNSTKP